MEPGRMPQQTSPSAQNASSSATTSPQNLNQEQVARNAMQNLLRRVENRFVKGLQSIHGDRILEDVSVDDMYHDPTLFPEGDSAQRGGARVLQAPSSEGNSDYMSLEVDEVAALQDVLKRVQSAKTRASTTAEPPYTVNGYFFKSKYEFYKALYDHGFLKFTSVLDEPPLATLNESEAEDLARLERLDGFMGTKEMMKEMEHMD